MSSPENIPEKTHVKSVRTVRREGQKGTEEFVIKTRIGSVMANLDMRKAVDELVLDVSKRLHRMSILCNLRVRQAIDEKVSFGHMFDQSYIRRMMMETDIAAQLGTPVGYTKPLIRCIAIENECLILDLDDGNKYHDFF